MNLRMSLVALFVAATPLMAQESPEEDHSLKSEQELIAEILGLLKDVSDDMGNLQQEIARVSIPALKPDEVAAMLETWKDRLRSGEAAEIPLVVKEHFEAHPDKLAQALGLSVDEAKALLKDDAKALEKMREAADKVVEELSGEDFLKAAVERHSKVEDDMDKVLERQSELGRKTQHGIDGVLERAYELRRQSSGDGKCDNPLFTQESEKPSDQDSPEKKPGEKKPSPEKPEAGKEETAEGGKGQKPDDLLGNQERELDEGAWDAALVNKDHERATSSESENAEPGQYKGFGERFRKELAKKEREGKE